MQHTFRRLVRIVAFSLTSESWYSSMVRESYRRSEGFGFDSHLGLRNIFLSMRLISLSLSKALTHYAMIHPLPSQSLVFQIVNG